MARKPLLKPVEAMELRLMRESGVSVKEAAAYFGVSEWTALRALRKLRMKLGMEKLPNRQRARAQTFVSNASCRNLTSGSDKPT
jgi:predicted DNA-binding protein (UPF0251 family)